MRHIRLLLPACVAALAALPATALAGTTGAGPVSGASGGGGIGGSGTTESTPEHPMVVGNQARVVDGVAFAPSYAPPAVKAAIWAGDRIRRKPYEIGGGHGHWSSRGYDCSGTVSYVLHAAGLLRTPEASGELAGFGDGGPGEWITVYANGSHAFVEIAGVRLDTSAEDDPDPAPGSGPRWRPVMDATPGFVVRHPVGY